LADFAGQIVGTLRVGNKQVGLLAWLACLLTNQASQQAGRPILSKQASQMRLSLQASLPA